MLSPSVDQDLLYFPQGDAHFTHTCKRVHIHMQVTYANTDSHAHKQVHMQRNGCERD